MQQVCVKEKLATLRLIGILEGWQAAASIELAANENAALNCLYENLKRRAAWATNAKLNRCGSNSSSSETTH